MVPTWLKSLFPRRATRNPSPNRNSLKPSRPSLVQLEDRAVPANISITDVAIAEGNSGTSTLTFTVTASQAEAADITFDINTSDLTATAGSDYVAIINGAGKINAGETSTTILVTINGDTLVELDETFKIVLSNLSAGNTFTDDTATGTILNDDQAKISISNPSIGEGGLLAFSVTIDNKVDVAVTADRKTADGTATSVSNDYTSIANSNITLFAANSNTAKTINIVTTTDSLVELDETLSVILSNLAASGRNVIFEGGGSSLTGTGTILNDDQAKISISNPTVTEGGTLAFTVSIDNKVDVAIMGNRKTQDGTAIAPGDYTAITDANVTLFAANTNTSFNINVTTINDSVVEFNETLSLILSNLTASGRDVIFNGGGSSLTGTGTINDNDTAQFQVTANASATEGSPVTFTITLTNPVQTTTSVTITTADITATAGTDYTDATGQVVTFDPLVTSKTFSVLTTSDNVVEADETFSFTIGGLDDGGLASVTIDNTQKTRTGTILNDDSAQFKITSMASATEGSPVMFVVTLTNPVDTATSVTVTTANGTANQPGDYTKLNGVTVNFAAGITSQDVMVTTIDDATLESDETFTVTLGGLNNGGRSTVTIDNANKTGTGTIIDNDGATLLIDDITMMENAGTFTFTVTLVGDVEDGFAVSFKTVDNTATTADSDYNSNTGTLNFAGTDGETKTVTVTINNDNQVEADETFFLQLFNVVPVNNKVAAGSINVTDKGVGTIQNDDAAQFSITKTASATEGNKVSFTVTLSNPVDVATSVTVTTADGTAIAGTDYTKLNALVVNFAANTTSQVVQVTTSDDNIVETDESFTITLGGLNNGGRATVTIDGANDTGTGTIVDNDSATFSITNASATEGGLITFTITLSNPVSTDTSVTVTTSDLTAVDGVDYTGLVAVPVLFPALTTSKTITVATTPDTIVEADETFKATLGGLNDGGFPGKVTISGVNGSATGTILNDDSTTLTIGDVSQLEASGAMKFTVTLGNGVQGGFKVDFKTSDGTAKVSDNDYVALLSTLTFAGTPGETQSVLVTINDDNRVEADEVFNVSTLNVVPNDAGVSPAKITNGSATGTIQNDDASKVSIAKTSSATEGGQVKFTISLTNPIDVPISVNVTTSDGSAKSTGAPAFDNDFVFFTAKTIIITADSTSADVFVTTNSDNIVELDETFSVVMGGLVNNGRSTVTIDAGNSVGTGTILNDDAAQFKINSASATEGNPIAFTVTLTNPVDVATTVEVTTANLSAAAPGDYTSLTGFVVNFPALSTSQAVSVSTVSDLIVEGNETFSITLGNATVLGRDVTISATDKTGIGTILNDDKATLLTIANVTQNEDAGMMTFTVQLTADVQDGFNVDIMTKDGTATVADGDYPFSMATLSFLGLAGETKSFAVPINADNKVEANETFTVHLANVAPNNSKVSPADIDATSIGTGTIVNDDSTVLTIDNVSLAENAGMMTFSVKLSNPVQGGFKVSFATTDGTAKTSDNDYTATSGVLTFAGTAGETQTFQVPIVGDTTIEPDEFFNVKLSNVVTLGAGVPAGKIDASDTAIGTILNDDNAVISLTASSAVEGSNLVYTISLSNAISKDVSVDFTTLAGVGLRPATSGVDFTAVAKTITFTAGTTTQTVLVPLADDRRVEGSEQFDAKISNIVADPSILFALSIGKGTDTATILDNDTAVFAFTKADNGALENNIVGETATVQLTVNAIGAGADGIDLPITVRVSNTGSTATKGVDFKNFVTTDLSFAPGNFTTTSQNIGFDIVEDLNKEGDETILFSIGIQDDKTGTQAKIGAIPTHTYTIISDDEAVRTYDATVAGNYRFVNDGAGNVQLFLAATLLSTDKVGTQAILLNGTANTAQATEGVENAMVDYANGSPVPSGGITFNANGPAVGESFTIAGGKFTSILSTLTGSQSGTLTLTGTTTDTLNYVNVDGVVIAPNAVGTLTIQLPSTASQAILEDDGTAGNGFSQIRSANGTFATTKFSNPSGSLVIVPGNAADTIQIDSILDTTASLIVGAMGNRLASITQLGTVNSTGDVRYFALSIAISPTDLATLSAVGAVELNATKSLTLGTTNLSGNTVTQTGGSSVTITASDLATLSASATSGNAIVFDGTIDGPGGLSAITAATTIFNSSIGSNTPLNTLATDAGGNTVVNGAIVVTSATQSFGDATTFSQNVNFSATGGTIVFGDTLNPTTAGLNLTTGGPAVNATFAKAIGGIAPVGLLTVTNANNATFNGVTATKFVQLAGSGQTQLNGTTTITSGDSKGGKDNAALVIATNSVDLNGFVSVANNPIALNLAAGATQTSGSLTTTKLYLDGAGDFTLNAAQNLLTTVAAGTIKSFVTTVGLNEVTDVPGVQALPGELFANLSSGSIAVRDSSDLVIRFEDATRTPAIQIGNNGNATLIAGNDVSIEDPQTVDLTISASKITPLLTVGKGVVQVFVGIDRDNPLTDSSIIRYLAEAQAGSVVLGSPPTPNDTFDVRITTTDFSNPANLENVAKDTFTVRPMQGSELTVHGNSPVVKDPFAFRPYDTLSPQFAGIGGANLTPAGAGNGKFTFGNNFQPLSFTSIETLGGVQAEAFVVQTGPSTTTQANNYAVRFKATISGQPVTGGDITGNGIITNPFVVTPSVGGSMQFSAPQITFADVDGDTTPDLIVANGPGDAPLVTIIRGSRVFTGNSINISALDKATDIISQFYAFEETFRGGVTVRAADFDNDGRAEIAVSPGNGGGPRITVFKIDTSPAASVFKNATIFGAEKGTPYNFFPYEASFRGGVNVAVGDVNGDGVPDIIAGAGIGGGPRVRVYDGKIPPSNFDNGAPGPNVLADFFAYDPAFRGGVFVDAGRFDSDAIADLVTAPGPGGGPHIQVFQGRKNTQPFLEDSVRGAAFRTAFASFFAFENSPSLINQQQVLTGVGGVSFGASTDGFGANRSILVTRPTGSPFEIVKFEQVDPTVTLTPDDVALGIRLETAAPLGIIFKRTPQFQNILTGFLNPGDDKFLPYSQLVNGGSAAGSS